MKILEVLKIRKHLGIAILSAIAIFSVYVYTQVLFIVENIDLWFTVIPPQNLILFTIFSVLFGVTISYQIYLWRQPKVCAIKKTSTPGVVGSIISFFVVQCPACASIGALFLPLSVIGFFTAYSTLINIGSITLLLVTLYLLGGFKREQSSLSYEEVNKGIGLSRMWKQGRKV